jgi:hypothetical protein
MTISSAASALGRKTDGSSSARMDKIWRSPGGHVASCVPFGGFSVARYHCAAGGSDTGYREIVRRDRPEPTATCGEPREALSLRLFPRRRPVGADTAMPFL